MLHAAYGDARSETINGLGGLPRLLDAANTVMTMVPRWLGHFRQGELLLPQSITANSVALQ